MSMSMKEQKLCDEAYNKKLVADYTKELKNRTDLTKEEKNALIKGYEVLLENELCYKYDLPKGHSIRKVIFNPPAVVVFWEDDTKTVAKAHHEPYDPEKGLMVAILKKMWNGDGSQNRLFKTLCREDPLKSWEKYGIEVEQQIGSEKYWRSIYGDAIMCCSDIDDDEPNYIQESMHFEEDDLL